MLSTIISISKNNRGSINSSDNYRGISLSNSIGKLYGYVFIHLNMDYLKTDDMQFGFKNNHSTVLCTAVYIETINHYMNKCSDVYSCLIDANNAFDRVHWGGLFSILIDKKVSYIYFFAWYLTVTSDKKHMLHRVFLDLNTSYFKMELSKAGFYLLFSLLYILENFL